LLPFPNVELLALVGPFGVIWNKSWFFHK
jgi:hypothetical protein